MGQFQTSHLRGRNQGEKKQKLKILAKAGWIINQFSFYHHTDKLQLSSWQKVIIYTGALPPPNGHFSYMHSLHGTVGFNLSLTMLQLCAASTVRYSRVKHTAAITRAPRSRYGAVRADGAVQCSHFARGLSVLPYSVDRSTLTNRFVLVPHSIGLDLDLDYCAFPPRSIEFQIVPARFGRGIVLIAQVARPNYCTCRVLCSAVLLLYHTMFTSIIS